MLSLDTGSAGYDNGGREPTRGVLCEEPPIVSRGVDLLPLAEDEEYPCCFARRRRKPQTMRGRQGGMQPRMRIAHISEYAQSRSGVIASVETVER